MLFKKITPISMTIASFLFLSTSVKAEIKFEINPNEIQSEEELSAIHMWLAETETKLPPVFQNLNRTITLEFNPEIAGTSESFYKPFCPSTFTPNQQTEDNDLLDGLIEKFRKKNTVLGRTLFKPLLKTQAHRIQLNPRFIHEIVRGRENSTQYPCGHRNYYDLAQATLIHELMHVYDMSTSFFQATLSDDEHFQVLAGWYKRGILFPELESSNAQTFRFPQKARSPDPYEFESTRESLAVHFEYFVMDPSYACRKPGLYRLFSQRLGFRPHPETDCQSFRWITLQNNSPSSKRAVEYFDLDPSRLYQIHYLLADTGQAMMSRWGHSMFRLVYCSPRRKNTDGSQYVGPDCIRDVGHHLVVSYRAHITEPRIDSLKGLMGKYPSQMFILTLADVVKEYTVGELRDVLSYPLLLDSNQRAQFVDQVMDQYWSYQGRYYFLSNNCAVESMNLIKAATGNSIMMDENIFTPKGLIKALKKSGLLDDSMFANLVRALQGKKVKSRIQGKGGSSQIVTRYVPDEKQIDAEMKALTRAGLMYRSAHWGLANDYVGLTQLNGGNPLPWSDVKSMLQNSNAQARIQFYYSLKERISKLSAEDRNALAAKFPPNAPISLEGRAAIHMFSIEEFILQSQQTIFMKSIGERLFLDSNDSKENAVPEEIQQRLAQVFDLQKSMLPWMRTTSGYGIPIDSEVIKFDPTENQELAETAQAIMKEVQEFVLKKFAEEAKPLKESAQNVGLLREEIQRINFNQGQKSQPNQTQPNPVVP